MYFSRNSQNFSSASFRQCRYAGLLGKDWQVLPAIIQKRFSQICENGEVRIYKGEVVKTKLNLAGRILAHIARFIGAPLPYQNDLCGAACVMVYEDTQVNGQVWTRVYERPGRFPQAISTAKRFAGPTGLEEYVGAGVGMALRLQVEKSALLFVSDHYFWQLGRFRWRWPGFLEPGEMIIRHKQVTEDKFSFQLTLRHPVFGELVHQLAYFKEV